MTIQAVAIGSHQGNQEIADMDNDVKNKQAELTAINSRLNAIQRKRTGNLVSRDLSGDSAPPGHPCMFTVHCWQRLE